MRPLTPASPHAIFMVGIPGAGKSTFAERFADTFQTPIINRNKLQHDLSLSEDQVDGLVEVMLKEFMKSSKTIVLEGNLDTQKYRADLIDYFKKKGYRALVVWVQTDTNEALRRAVKPIPQGSGISANAFADAVATFEPPHDKEKAIVVSGKHTYGTQLKAVLKQIALNSRQQKPSAPAASQPRGRNSVSR